MPSKRKRGSDSDPDDENLEDIEVADRPKAPLWTIGGVGCLLSAIKNKASQLKSFEDTEDVWREISEEISDKVPWVTGSACLERWNDCKRNVYNYDSDQEEKFDPLLPKPEFYHAITTIISEIEETKDENDSEKNGDIAGVEDSDGIFHPKKVLIDVYNQLLENEMNVEVVSEKSGVNEFVVKFVADNMKIISKWNNMCKFCKKNIEDLSDISEHELICCHESSYSLKKVKDVRQKWDEYIDDFMLELILQKLPDYEYCSELPVLFWKEICVGLRHLKDNVTHVSVKNRFKHFEDHITRIEKIMRKRANSGMPTKITVPHYYQKTKKILKLIRKMRMENKEKTLQELSNQEYDDEDEEELSPVVRDRALYNKAILGSLRETTRKVDNFLHKQNDIQNKNLKMLQSFFDLWQEQRDQNLVLLKEIINTFKNEHSS